MASARRSAATAARISLAALSAALAAPATAAETARRAVGIPIGEAAGHVASQLPSATRAFEGGSLLAGTYLGVSGLARLRAASSAKEGGYAAGAWKLAVGSGLAMLPFVADSATRTAGLGGLIARGLGAIH